MGYFGDPKSVSDSCYFNELWPQKLPLAFEYKHLSLSAVDYWYSLKKQCDTLENAEGNA